MEGLKKKNLVYNLMIDLAFDLYSIAYFTKPEYTLQTTIPLGI
jgi:hypothetical protein